MPVHAQRQGFDALQQLPRGLRMQACAEVAQALAAGAQQERRDRAFLGEDHAVKAVVGFGEFGEAAGRVKSNVPPSTSTPPIVVPWPPRNLVAE